MKFRSMILVLTIAFSAIFASMIGTSYAYYVATDGTKIDVTTGNIDTGVAVIFEESQYININNAIPVLNFSYAEDYIFTIIPNSDILNNKEFFIEIGITDIYIDEALIVDDFKYELSCWWSNDPTVDIWLDYGSTGLKFTDEVIAKDYLSLGYLSSDDVALDGYYTCSLSIWLQETGENQNHLMNKKFRGLIKVNTIFR